MKHLYYEFIQRMGVSDVLKAIPVLPYSVKMSILGTLLDRYKPYIVNTALFEYQRDYIDKNRVDLKRVKNQLKSLCNIIQERNNER